MGVTYPEPSPSAGEGGNSQYYGGSYTQYTTTCTASSNGYISTIDFVARTPQISTDFHQVTSFQYPTSGSTFSNHFPPSYPNTSMPGGPSPPFTTQQNDPPPAYDTAEPKSSNSKDPYSQPKDQDTSPLPERPKRFCTVAIRDRQDNEYSDGMRSHEYQRPCSSCKLKCDRNYLIDPRNSRRKREKIPFGFMFQSHLAPLKGDRRMLFGCLICYENRNVEVEAMEVAVWIRHTRNHFEEGVYRVCENRDGVMMRKGDCERAHCGRIHY